MALKLVPVFLFSYFFGGGGVQHGKWYLHREKSPLGLAPLLGTWLRGLAFLLAPFMALFHQPNSAGENPLVRRVAHRGEDLCKTRLVGSSPAAIILNFTHGLPVYEYPNLGPNSRARAGRRVYSHELPGTAITTTWAKAKGELPYNSARCF
jgi:hypothetical protein